MYITSVSPTCSRPSQCEWLLLATSCSSDPTPWPCGRHFPKLRCRPLWRPPTSPCCRETNVVKRRTVEEQWRSALCVCVWWRLFTPCTSSNWMHWRELREKYNLSPELVPTWRSSGWSLFIAGLVTSPTEAVITERWDGFTHASQQHVEIPH